MRQLSGLRANVIKIDVLMEGRRRAAGRPAQCAMTLYLKHSRGFEAFGWLVKKADIVVETFQLDMKARLGFDYDIKPIASRNCF